MAVILPMSLPARCSERVSAEERARQNDCRTNLDCGAFYTVMMKIQAVTAIQRSEPKDASLLNCGHVKLQGISAASDRLRICYESPQASAQS